VRRLDWWLVFSIIRSSPNRRARKRSCLLAVTIGWTRRAFQGRLRRGLPLSQPPLALVRLKTGSRPYAVPGTSFRHKLLFLVQFMNRKARGMRSKGKGEGAIHHDDRRSPSANATKCPAEA